MSIRTEQHLRSIDQSLKGIHQELRKMNQQSALPDVHIRVDEPPDAEKISRGLTDRLRTNTTW